MTIVRRAAASLMVLALLGAASAAWAQAASGAPARTRSVSPQEFLRLAYSSATLQGQAAKLAAERDTAPDVKSYAASAAEFRARLLRRIEAFARDKGLQLPGAKEFEHQVIIENLEPLDYLALSRRYAEIQIQALDQEITIYKTTSENGGEPVREFAAQVLPELEQQRAGALKMFETIRP